MPKREANVSDFYGLEDACPYSSENVFVPEALDWVSIVPIYCQKHDPNRLFIHCIDCIAMPDKQHRNIR